MKIRDIKFRAEKADMTVVYGYFLERGGDAYIVDGSVSNVDFAPREHKVKRETVCQFTGRRGKDLQEIYEHDIIAFHRDRCDTYREVVWNFEKSCWCVGDTPISQYAFDELDVVGNRFSNPHLVREIEETEYQLTGK